MKTQVPRFIYFCDHCGKELATQYSELYPDHAYLDHEADPDLVSVTTYCYKNAPKFHDNNEFLMDFCNWYCYIAYLSGGHQK